MDGEEAMLRLVVPAILMVGLMAGLAARGGEDPTPTARAAPPPTAIPEPTAMPEPTATTEPTAMPASTERPANTPVPTAAAPAAVVATAIPEPTPIPPTLTPEPAATAPPPATEEELLAQYAAEHAGGPGAMFMGHPANLASFAQLIGPPVHEGLVFLPPGEGQQAQFQQLSQVGLFGLEQLGVPGHQFIYTSDYYRELIEKAKLLSPTEPTSSGESIEIQHVCISRNLPTCVIMEAHFAPRVAARTQGQVQVSITSFPELSGARGGGITQESLNLVGEGTLDMANIYTGYVSGALPAIEVQSVWGMGPDWESTYLALMDMIPDVEWMLTEETGGSIVKRNRSAGADQWSYSKEPLQTPENF